MSDLAAALQIAIQVHADQRDKQGQPYLLHVLRVVEAVSDEAKVVAALHDAFENGEWSDNDASEVCAALNRSEVAALDLLTHVPDDTYADYIERIASRAQDDEAATARRCKRGIITLSPSAGVLAREVKLADLHDNLERIPPRPGSGAWPEQKRWWDHEWGSLKRRYEREIQTLEGRDAV